MLKGTKLYSILFQKCPRCHQGELFEERNPYRIGKLFDMPHQCAKCGQIYQLEPSFFYGAMYVNYGLTVAIAIGIYVAMWTVRVSWELNDYLIGIITGIIALAPLTFRLGRAIWINMFIKYDPTSIKEQGS